MLTGVGTPQEQWAEAGVEVFLGRLTPQELHDLGTRLFREMSFEVEEANRERDRFERQLEEAEEQAELEEEKADAEILRLRERIGELEDELESGKP